MIDFIKISPKRHLLKTISYRVVSSVIGFLILWLFFGITVGVSFSLFELFCKPLLYYIHERIWYRWIKFGLVGDSEKKKKSKGLTKGKIKNQHKVYEDELSENLPPPKPTEKKVLNYSSNR